MTALELEALLGLLGQARHIVIGTDFAARTDAARIATTWGGLARRPRGRHNLGEPMKHALLESPIGPLTVVGEVDVVTGLYFPNHWPRPDRTTFGDRDDTAFPEAPRRSGATLLDLERPPESALW